MDSTRFSLFQDNPYINNDTAPLKNRAVFTFYKERVPWSDIHIEKIREIYPEAKEDTNTYLSSQENIDVIRVMNLDLPDNPMQHFETFLKTVRGYIQSFDIITHINGNVYARYTWNDGLGVIMLSKVIIEQ